ncbi:MAG: hypothetical protein KME45_08425 [Stenomitos rutilans HA7619-LM2]|jgi:hypothetical protein|nr:hypothetical protein [Stenomitos rutilans HA7619-LM2]
MDELQARFRARRSLQTEMHLAKQPYPEFEDSEFEGSNEGAQQGDANVVEMPHRQKTEAPSEAPAQGSTTKRKPVAKRKSATPLPKAFSFRQMRDGHQQPYIDELKRLEAQAERINQLLAERKRKKAQAEQDALTGDAAPGSAAASPSKKKATRSSKHSPRSPQREVPPMPAQDDDTEALEAQAERIKQLLQELETALIEGEPTAQDAIAPGNTRDRTQSGSATSVVQPPPASGVEAFGTSIYRYGANGKPVPANQPPLSLHSDQKAQQEATETAQALRSLASRDGGRALVEPSMISGYPEVRRGRSRTSQSPLGFFSVRRYGLQLRQLLQLPQKSIDKIGDAVLWIVLAAAIRVGSRLLLAMVPALTPVFLVLMFAPAALAVYLALFVPRAGFVSIYRLFLIMLGLLLGGRL